MTTTDDTPVRWREILTREHRMSLVLVCMGVWLHAADSLLVATMIPTIVADIGGANLIPWTIALYQIGSIITGVASGLVALRSGIRLPMALAAIVFAFGCIVSAMAPEMWILLGGRLLQGLGGGGLMALSFVSVATLFPRRLSARVLGAVSALWGASAFLGPLVGGIFVELGHWRGGFWFFAVQAVFLALWIHTKIDEKAKPPSEGQSERFPIQRLVLLTAGIVAVAYAGVEVSLVPTTGFLLFGVLCLILFLRFDARHEASRMLPRHAISLTDPAGAGLTMLFCMAGATAALAVYGPLLLTSLNGTSALVAGYIIAMGSIGWSCSAVLVSGAPERHEAKFIMAGMTIVTICVCGFVYSVPYGPVWLTAIFATLDGAGFGMAYTFILGRLRTLAAEGETERIAAALATLQRVGYALFAGYVGILANAFRMDPNESHATLTTAAFVTFAGCVPVALVGLIAMMRFLRAKPLE